MGLLGNMLDKIFDRKAERPHDAAPAGRPNPSKVEMRNDSPDLPPLSEGAHPVDIESRLDAMEKANPQDLDWRHSIVDLMKLVGMDSSLSERRELADELGYDGDKSDSATMNIWLHKQVMKKLEENGGRVPPELLD